MLKDLILFTIIQIALFAVNMALYFFEDSHLALFNMGLFAGLTLTAWLVYSLFYKGL